MFSAWAIRSAGVRMRGVITSSTREVMIAPNAAPIMTAMARSITFPLRANSLNSFANPMALVLFLKLSHSDYLFFRFAWLWIFHVESAQTFHHRFCNQIFFVPVLVGRHNLPGNAITVLKNIFIHLHVFVPKLSFLIIIFIIFPAL